MGKSNYKIIIKFCQIRRGSGKNYAVVLHNFTIPVIYWCILFNCSPLKILLLIQVVHIVKTSL